MSIKVRGNELKRALITGASSGIGEAYARSLAARRMNLVLVARRVDRLQSLADELREQHGVEVEVLPADLSDSGQLATVERRVGDESKPIDLLINNAGFGKRGELQNQDIDQLEELLRVNVVALVRLTHAAVSAMRPRKAGAIINISSVASFYPWSHFSTYAASKSFVTTFTEAVSNECAGSGVRLLAVCPSATDTEFHSSVEWGKMSRSVVSMSPEAVVRQSLRALRRGQALTISGSRNRMWVWLTKPLPNFIKRPITGVFGAAMDV